MSTLRDAATGELTVLAVDRKQRRRNPAPPFTTSTLQQEASRKLGFSAQKTMRVAQQLYEGVDIGEGAVGLITYMRTDSLNLAQEAVGADPRGHRQALRPGGSRRGTAGLPHQVQERPGSPRGDPPDRRAASCRRTSRSKLEADQFRLYSLIWKRTVACQMAPAVFDTVAVELLAGADGARSARCCAPTARRWSSRAIYRSTRKAWTTSCRTIRIMCCRPWTRAIGSSSSASIPSQHFTEPPPRFSEASLVKALEEYGIGRPSTYASIISTLRDREYVEIESRRFTATDIGKIVSRFLTHYFTIYVDYDFTAKMEDSLDAVASGEQEWVPLLDRFWKPFIKLVKHTENSVSREEVAQARDLGHRSGERQAHERAHGPLRTVRADRHQGRRGQAALRGPAARPEDGRHHARGGAVAVPAAAQARDHRARARRSRPIPAASAPT